MRLPLGKLPPDVLEKYVISRKGFEDSDVVLGPKLGVDFAAVRLGDSYLIVSSDPITGATSNIGSYAVNVSANDVATSGARPRFIEAVILLPKDSNTENVSRVSGEIDEAAKALKLSILGGHTELTPRLSRPIVVTTAFGLTDRFVTAGDARLGDAILMTKSAGVEGTYILASLLKKDYEDHVEGMLRAYDMIKKLSVVEEAGIAFKTGFVHAMHDPTEGGVLGGIIEMASASNLGFYVEESKIPVADETMRMCQKFSIDPLKLIGSGSLLIAVPKSAASYISDQLKSRNILVSQVGYFTEEGRVLERSDGRAEELPASIIDEIWRIFEEKGIFV